MTIHYFKGDLLQAREPVLAHGCNAKGVMGAGVARAIARRYPEVARLYAAFCRQYPTNCGDVYLAKVADDHGQPRWIVNMVTQYSYGPPRGYPYVNLTDLRECLIKLREILDQLGQTEVAMPRIGCGFGGQSWGLVAPIIEEELAGYHVRVYDL